METRLIDSGVSKGAIRDAILGALRAGRAVAVQTYIGTWSSVKLDGTGCTSEKSYQDQGVRHVGGGWSPWGAIASVRVDSKSQNFGSTH